MDIKVTKQKMNDQNSLIDLVRPKQLEWYGHVRRMTEAILPK